MALRLCRKTACEIHVTRIHVFELRSFRGTLLNDRRQDCTSLGGAVRVSNRIIIPNDFVMFEIGDDVDSFGYMLTRTPIGKRSDTDDANYWTILRCCDFAGPVMYMSNWFWDMRTNWDPTSAWSDPRSSWLHCTRIRGWSGCIYVRKMPRRTFVFENIITYEPHTHFIPNRYYRTHR